MSLVVVRLSPKVYAMAELGEDGVYQPHRPRFESADVARAYMERTVELRTRYV